MTISTITAKKNKQSFEPELLVILQGSAIVRQRQVGKHIRTTRHNRIGI